MLEDDDAGTSYRWEAGVTHTWDSVREDEHGNIVTTSLSDRERSKRAKKSRVAQSIRRGLIRYLVVLLDCSSASLEKDYRPSRFDVMKSATEKFIMEFYDQNPISQLGIAVTRDRVAERISELSGNAKAHINALKQIIRADGLPSLQNSLNIAKSMLKYVPDYGHRELLIIYNSLSSCDPGDIFKTIEVKNYNKHTIIYFNEK